MFSSYLICTVILSGVEPYRFPSILMKTFEEFLVRSQS